MTKQHSSGTCITISIDGRHRRKCAGTPRKSRKYKRETTVMINPFCTGKIGHSLTKHLLLFSVEMYKITPLNQLSNKIGFSSSLNVIAHSSITRNFFPKDFFFKLERKRNILLISLSSLLETYATILSVGSVENVEVFLNVLCDPIA